MASRLRRALFTLHLVLGLSVGLMAVVLGLTGSLLVYRHEIDAALHPNLLRVQPRPEKATLERMTSSVRAAFPNDPPLLVFLPRQPHETSEFWMKRESLRVYVDPYTGQVLGSRTAETSAMGFVLSLHTKLLSGERGEAVVGWVGVGLMLLSATGLMVWWPRGRQKARDHVRVKWSASCKRVTYDLHRAGGFYACGLLLLAGLTGSALVFPDFFGRLAARLTASPAPAAKPKASKSAGGPSLPLDELASRAEAALPGGRLIRVSFPAKAGAPVVFRKRFPNELHPNGMNNISVDPVSGTVLRVDRSDAAQTGQRLMNLRYPWHIGVWAGEASRVLTVLAGLAPSFLFVTGLMMWWTRTRGKRSRRPAVEHAVGSPVPAGDPIKAEDVRAVARV